MDKVIVLLVVTFVCAVYTLPLKTTDLDDDRQLHDQVHKIRRRFVSPWFSLGMPAADNIFKIRTKRSYDECEKLQLCKLHARSRQSFFAAYELYFVNKENARFWDHRARSKAECEQRYGDCYYK